MLIDEKLIDVDLDSNSLENHENGEGGAPAHSGHRPKQDQHFVQGRGKFELALECGRSTFVGFQNIVKMCSM